MGGCETKCQGDALASCLHSNRTGSQGHKLEHAQFNLVQKKKSLFFTRKNWADLVAREAVKSVARC